MRERALTRLLVERAVAAGASALMLTVEIPIILSELANVEPVNWPDVPGRRRVGNLDPAERALLAPDAVVSATDLTLDDIGWLAELSGLPVVVKGVLRGDDAVRCVEAGARGILVSTHGGRRLGASISSARALPEIVDAVAGRAEIYVDSGLRSGVHVAAALALGATAAFIGRPVMWGLADSGQAGVEAVLGRLDAELAGCLHQLGADSVRDLTPDLVAR